MTVDDETLLPSRLTHERLQEVVAALCMRLKDPTLRTQSQRAIQAKVWHLEPCVSQLMRDLKHDELTLRTLLLQKASVLVYEFHSHTLDATLARAGLTSDDRLIQDTSHKDVLPKDADLDLRCLDAKERLYVLLQQYGWLPDFFRSYPHHFYENSFSFVSRIPTKPLVCKAKVIGLGVGGSMAVSGMAKHGIDVTGVEKRERPTSRYQNASWRAYDTAEQMVDQAAFEELVSHRQRIQVNNSVVTFSDRVQIVIGHAVDTALQSARRYGAQLHIGESDPTLDSGETFDLCAIFCGAHTSVSFPALEMNVLSWPHLESTCKMWLQLMPNDPATDETDDPDGNSCTRQGEIGAEHWNFTISSTRHSEEDLERLLYNLDSQYAYAQRKLIEAAELEHATAKYHDQRGRVTKILTALREKQILNYQYIFTNAPANPHNLAKREAVVDSIVIDGGYDVPIQIATHSSFEGESVQQAFHSSVVVCGGDACVPPNPLAAYGATLACEAAYSAVQLAIGIGHMNAILRYMDDPQWIELVQEFKSLLVVHYEARARAENYFQFVQTLLCNLYSLPPQDP